VIIKHILIWSVLHTWAPVLWWLICHTEVSLHGNDTSINNLGLSELGFIQIQEYHIDRIVYLRCDRLSIICQEMPPSETWSLAISSRAVLHHPTLCDASLQCTWTNCICQEMPLSETWSLAISSRAVLHHPTLWDASLQCTWTNFICQEMVWICFKSASCVFYADTGTQYPLVCLYCQMGLENMQCSICHNKTQVIYIILQCTWQ